MSSVFAMCCGLYLYYFWH